MMKFVKHFVLTDYFLRGFKDMTLYIDIVMSVIKAISMMSKCGYTDKELLEYIDKHYDEIECELSGEVYEEPKKLDRYFCMGCKLRKTVDYEKVDFGLHQIWSI